MDKSESKLTSDGTEVPPRMWYYLLDYNDRDSWVTMRSKYNTSRLGELTHIQFADLFMEATQSDLKFITKKHFG